MYVNWPDKQLGVFDAAGNPIDLIPTTAADLGAAPADHTHDFPVDSVNGLTGDVVLTHNEVGAAAVDHNHAGVYSPADHTHDFPVDSVNGMTGDVVLDFPVDSVNGKTGDVVLAAADVGAAPAAHTHDATQIVSGTIADARLPARLGPSSEQILDWDAATKSGWYWGLPSALNTPSTLNYQLGMVEAHEPNWITQTVHMFMGDGASNTDVWRRDRNNGTWTAWYKLQLSQAEQDARYALAQTFAPGSVLFAGADGKPTQDTSAFNYNSSNKRFTVSGWVRGQALSASGAAAGSIQPSQWMVQNENGVIRSYASGDAPTTYASWQHYTIGSDGTSPILGFVSEANGDFGIGTKDPAATYGTGFRNVKVSGASGSGFICGTDGVAARMGGIYATTLNFHISGLKAGNPVIFSAGPQPTDEIYRISSDKTVQFGCSASIAGGRYSFYSSGGNCVVLQTGGSGQQPLVTMTPASAYGCIIADTGQIYSTSTTISALSDATKKENVEDIAYGLSAVEALRPVSFNFKPELGVGTDTRLGFIAQDVEPILPELVGDMDGSKTLKMGDMIPVLVRAIQELSAEIAELKRIAK
jgi:hypothetical protein